jgi:hypothetical protein
LENTYAAHSHLIKQRSDAKWRRSLNMREYACLQALGSVIGSIVKLDLACWKRRAILARYASTSSIGHGSLSAKQSSQIGLPGLAKKLCEDKKF